MKELKEWVKPFETKESIKKIGNIGFGFIESKDDFCRIHKIDYENECHQMPSGKITWYGCPKCGDEERKFRLIQEAKKEEQKRLAKLNQPEEIYQPTVKKAKGF